MSNERNNTNAKENTMNANHLRNELARTTAEVMLARHAFKTASTKKAKRQAALDLEFWTNKAAFLLNAK